MNRPEFKSLAVVVALTNPTTPAFGASLARFAEQVGTDGEVLLVDSSATTTTLEIAGRFDNVRVIPRPSGRLAPTLWRDGLLATEAALVAFTTAQMIPSSGWFASLRSKLHETGAAGVGGLIEPGSDLSMTDRAVALLRYSSYFPPLPDPSHVDPPGDNAMYCRESLMAVESAWLGGFWEVEVHKALRDRGATLAMAESAVVTFAGGVGLLSTVRQRIRHARSYGAGRSAGLSPIARLARVLTCPLVPPLLCLRIVKALRLRGMALAPWLPALPCLIVLASAWAIGEAVGIWHGYRTRPDDQSRELVTQLT